MNKLWFWCRIFVCSGILISCLNSSTNAQDSLQVHRANLYWVHVGFGGSSAGGAVGFGFSYRANSNLFSIRFNSCPEIVGIPGPSPTEYVADIGVLYGINAISSDFIASIAAGIGLAGGVRRGQFLYNSNFVTSVYEEESYTAVGIPIKAQFCWTFSPAWGIEIYGFGQFNHQRSFGGGLLCVQYVVLL